MIHEWLLYAVACSALVGMAGLAAERTLQLFALPQRWAWAGAIVASLVLPLSLPRLHAPGSPETSPAAATFPTLSAAGVVAPVATVDPAPDGPRLFERAAVGTWLLGSLVLAGWLALSGFSLHRARTRWSQRIVDGTPVLVSRDVGPAVVGWLAGEVVLPAWVLNWDEPRRRLVVAHEREHIQARDPLLLIGGWLSLALAPWCLPLWWQVHRLRVAVEVDCDRRVLRHVQDVRAYGTLLLEVGRRAERGWIPAAAFSEPRRTLERRLEMITWKRPRNRSRHAAAALAATALVPAALFALPAVDSPSVASLGDLLERRIAVQEPAVLWITAGDEFRIGRSDAPVVREEQLDEALAAIRAGGPGSATLIVRSDSARIAAPGMGYSAIVAANAACRAGFAAVLYELVTRVPGSAGQKRVGAVERRLLPPCDGSGSADTLRLGPSTEEAGGDALAEVSPGREGVIGSGRLPEDTIPDARVFVELGRLDRQPAVTNAREVTALMTRIYPAALREDGIGGQAVARFEVSVDGTVDTATIHISSATDERLVEPTRRIVRHLRFRPGELAGEAVRTRVHVPVTWTPAGASAAAEPPADATAIPADLPEILDRQAPSVRIRGENVPAVSPEMSDSVGGAASAITALRRAGGVSGGITGTVHDSGGTPIAGVAVRIDAAGLGSMTDAAGRFTLQGVPAGTHDVVAARVGYLASIERVAVRTGRTTTVDFTLAVAAVELQGVVAVGYGVALRRDLEAAAPSERATITGRVLDASGRPVFGASVVVPALSIGAITTDRGAFVLRVPLGDHEVHVLAPGAAQAVVRAVAVARASEPVSVEVRIPPR